MTFIRKIQCDGTCGAHLDWEGHPTQNQMNRAARKERWSVTQDGRHYCRSCQENRQRYRRK